MQLLPVLPAVRTDIPELFASTTVGQSLDTVPREEWLGLRLSRAALRGLLRGGQG